MLLVRRRQDRPVREPLPHGIDEGRLEARRGDGAFLWNVRAVAADEDVFLRVDGVGVVESRRIRVRRVDVEQQVGLAVLDHRAGFARVRGREEIDGDAGALADGGEDFAVERDVRVVLREHDVERRQALDELLLGGREMRDEAARAVFELLAGELGKARALRFERCIRVVDDAEQATVLPQARDGHRHGIESDDERFLLIACRCGVEQQVDGAVRERGVRLGVAGEGDGRHGKAIVLAEFFERSEQVGTALDEADAGALEHGEVLVSCREAVVARAAVEADEVAQRSRPGRGEMLGVMDVELHRHREVNLAREQGVADFFGRELDDVEVPVRVFRELDEVGRLLGKEGVRDVLRECGAHDADAHARRRRGARDAGGKDGNGQDDEGEEERGEQQRERGPQIAERKTFHDEERPPVSVPYQCMGDEPRLGNEFLPILFDPSLGKSCCVLYFLFLTKCKKELIV